MGACSALGKAGIEVGILVNIVWLGVPKNVGPRDCSKLKTATMAEEISAWRWQTIHFWRNLAFQFVCNFHFGGSPLGGFSSVLGGVPFPLGEWGVFPPRGDFPPLGAMGHAMPQL